MKALKEADPDLYHAISRRLSSFFSISWFCEQRDKAMRDVFEALEESASVELVIFDMGGNDGGPLYSNVILPAERYKNHHRHEQ